MNGEYILSLSYGKDSLACLGAIEKLGLPLTRIVHAEIWATETIPADLPPMVEFKAKADAIIKERYGIEVEHICALKTRGRVAANLHTRICSTEKNKKGNSLELSKDFRHSDPLGAKNSNTSIQRLTYEDVFYRISNGKHKGAIYGFPMNRGHWCVSKLKTYVLDKFRSQIIQVEREEGRAISRHRGRRTASHCTA